MYWLAQFTGEDSLREAHRELHSGKLELLWFCVRVCRSPALDEFAGQTTLCRGVLQCCMLAVSDDTVCRCLLLCHTSASCMRVLQALALLRCWAWVCLACGMLAVSDYLCRCLLCCMCVRVLQALALLPCWAWVCLAWARATSLRRTGQTTWHCLGVCGTLAWLGSYHLLLQHLQGPSRPFCSTLGLQAVPQLEGLYCQCPKRDKGRPWS
jgi:hypothetical protein